MAVVVCSVLCCGESLGTYFNGQQVAHEVVGMTFNIYQLMSKQQQAV